MIKMTKKQALMECMKHWEWVRDTWKSKNDYPFPGKVPTANCYCCQYVEDKPAKRSCLQCPLKCWAWSKDGCIACDKSLYLTFCVGPYRAARMAWSCYAALHSKYPSEFPLYVADGEADHADL